MSTNVFFTWRDGVLEPRHGSVVVEYPLQLIVNGREIATLIASPHDLRFLVAGFLRLQGFVRTVDDFNLLSVCDEFGTANVQIRGELPERLKPVLTSGCGTGITFSMPEAPHATDQSGSRERFTAQQIFDLMDGLARRAENYRSHGGIHSAAVGVQGSLLLYAEDLGRHNTLDRIAGEALLREIDLNGCMLVTSGRVSTEMVAKARLLGLRLIASRTSPTDMAVKLCDQSGICLVGYVRGSHFNVYSHAEMIDCYPASTRIAGVSGIILAGGNSRRMGSTKALLKLGEKTLIERVYHSMASLFQEVIVVTNTPQDYQSLPCRKVPDLHPDVGCIAGLQAGLSASSNERCFVAACDMPFLNADLIRMLCHQEQDAEAVVPVNGEGLREPLHAVYNRSILPSLQSAVLRRERSILDLLDTIDATLVLPAQYGSIPDAAASFRNVNTPEEFAAVRREVEQQ